MSWLTDPQADVGKRNAPVEPARVKQQTFQRYEDRWELLFIDEPDAPVLLPKDYRDLPKRNGLAYLRSMLGTNLCLSGDDQDRGLIELELLLPSDLLAVKFKQRRNDMGLFHPMTVRRDSTRRPVLQPCRGLCRHQTALRIL